MRMIFDEKKSCPDCCRQLLPGELNISEWKRDACLQWVSRDKYPQKSINPFKRGKLVDKAIRLDLIKNAVFFFEENLLDAQEPSWYCPVCGRVFASFRVQPMDIPDA